MSGLKPKLPVELLPTAPHCRCLGALRELLTRTFNRVTCSVKQPASKHYKSYKTESSSLHLELLDWIYWCVTSTDILHLAPHSRRSRTNRTSYTLREEISGRVLEICCRGRSTDRKPFEGYRRC